MSGKSEEDKSFQPNQLAPSIYIMIALCFFSLDQWEIRKHLLWEKCFKIPHNYLPKREFEKWKSYILFFTPDSNQTLIWHIALWIVRLMLEKDCFFILKQDRNPWIKYDVVILTQSWSWFSSNIYWWLEEDKISQMEKLGLIVWRQWRLIWKKWGMSLYQYYVTTSRSLHDLRLN